METPKFNIGQVVWGIRTQGTYPNQLFEIHGGEVEFTFFSKWFGYKIKNGDGLLFGERDIFENYKSAYEEREKRMESLKKDKQK